MRKSISLVMCLCALLSIGVSGCSSDDTEGMGMSSGDGKDAENVKADSIEKSSIDLSDCYVGQIHTFNLESIDEVNRELLWDMLNNHVFIPIISRPETDPFKDWDIQTVVISKDDIPSVGFRANDTVFFKIQKIMSAFPSDIHDCLYIYHDTAFLCSINICSKRAL